MATFKVGFREGLIHDQARRNWSGDGPRPIRWSAWYPTNAAAIEQPVAIPPANPLFVMGAVAREADLDDHLRCFPVILLSHGTGGTASSLGWLAQRLASAGYVVLGVDHHGNTASEPYRVEGFLCWWERARDLSLLLDVLAEAGPFASRLDLMQVACVGFSLGGYTVLSMLGAITDMTLFREWARRSALGRGPRELPDLPESIEPLLQESAVFRASWDRRSASHLDRRLRTAVVLAPAPPVRAFTPGSLAALTAPVTIMVGEADQEAPAEPCSVWLHRLLRSSSLHLLGRDVGHYTLLCAGTEHGRTLEPHLWVDAPGVDRSAVDEMATRISLTAISNASIGFG